MDMFEIRSEDYGELQRLVDALFRPGISSRATVSKIDVLTASDAFDFCDDLAEVIDLLPTRNFPYLRCHHILSSSNCTAHPE